jgi:hypothetical protein
VVNRHLILVSLAAMGPLASSAALSQVRPLARLEAGALDPDDPFNVTLAFGGAIGLHLHSSSLLLRVLRQSRNGNSGDDLTHGRSFILLEWELAGRQGGPMQRQPYLRFGFGRLARSPFRSSWSLDGAVGLRYRLVRSVHLLGTVGDQVAFLPAETLVRGGPQHNFALTLALEMQR